MSDLVYGCGSRKSTVSTETCSRCMLPVSRLGPTVAHAGSVRTLIGVYRCNLSPVSHSAQNSCFSGPVQLPTVPNPCSRTIFRSAALMVDHVDLTLSESDEDVPLPKPTPSTAATSSKPVSVEDDMKKRIMDFAVNKAAAKRTRTGDDDAFGGLYGSATAAAMQEATEAAATAVDDLQKQRIMNFARAKVAATSAGTKDHSADKTCTVGTEANAPSTSAVTEAVAAAADNTAAGDAEFSNLNLRALHEARMRRQQQQQQQQQQQDPAAAGVSSGAAGAATQQQAPTAAAAGDSTAAAATAAAAAAAAAGATGRPANQKTITLLTYNVWFKEDVAVLDRMMAIGELIKKAGHPTFLCLQEVTPFILELFVNMDWWDLYHCCPPPTDAPYFTLLLVRKAAAPGTSSSSFKERPFYNSVMGRSLRSITGSIAGLPILVATSHLESPIPPGNWYSQQRQEQMSEALKHLDAAGVGNVLFAGDMNWTDSRDGSPPLPSGWVDAWQKLQAGQPGFTYDSKLNPMLTFKGPGLRLDRILCKLRDWKPQSIKLVGTQPLPGVQHTHTFRNGGSKKTPVLPSDHFGLLLQLEEF